MRFTDSPSQYVNNTHSRPSPHHQRGIEGAEHPLELGDPDRFKDSGFPIDTTDDDQADLVERFKRG